MTTLVDPRAKSVNGDIKGRGRARFMGREVRLTKYDMKDAGVYFNYDGLRTKPKTCAHSLTRGETLSQEARGYQQTSKFTGLRATTLTTVYFEWFDLERQACVRYTRR